MVGYIQATGPCVFVQWVAMEIKDQQRGQFLEGTAKTALLHLSQCVCERVYVRTYLESEHFPGVGNQVAPHVQLKEGGAPLHAPQRGELVVADIEELQVRQAGLGQGGQ